MGKQNSKYQIEEFIAEFNRSVYHPILNRDIGQPKLNEHTALFLLLPKLNGEEWLSTTNTAAIAVGAVYTAFDAHDTVDVNHVTTTNEQLKVLSGDYLSGIYYQLLAKIPDFDFIHVLSTTIARINEIKTEFYTNKDQNMRDQIESIRSIQADCVLQFLQLFGYEKYIPIVKAALPFMALLRDEEGRHKDDLLSSWTVQDNFTEQALEVLKIELDEAISNADFLAPCFVEEIKKMTMPFYIG